MSKKAIEAQERLEKLVAGTEANPDGPDIGATTLQEHVETVNSAVYQVSQTKAAYAQALETRNAAIKAATDAAIQADYVLKAHYGRRSPKLVEYL